MPQADFNLILQKVADLTMENNLLRKEKNEMEKKIERVEGDYSSLVKQHVRLLIKQNENQNEKEQKLETIEKLKKKDQEKGQQIEKLKANANKFLLVFCTIVY